MKSKHFWLMLLCCLIPLVGIGVALIFGVSLGIWSIVALLLICPLSHILLMRGMGHESHHSGTASGKTASKDQ